MDFIEIGERTRARWQQSLDTLTRLLGVRAAAITRRHSGELEVLLSSDTAGNPLVPGMRMNALSGNGYCDAVIKERRPLHVSNALDDPHWRDSPLVQAGFVSYLGYPLLLPDGQVYGTLCLLGNRELPPSEMHLGIAADMHAQMEETLALAYERSLFGAQMDSLPGAALMADARDVVTRANRQFPLLWGIVGDAMSLSGRPLDEVRRMLAARLAVPAGIDDAMPHPAADRSDEAAAAQGHAPAGRNVVLADGRTLRCSYRTLRAGDGLRWGSVWLFDDITGELRAQEELARNEERLRLALDASSEAHWDWNFVSGELYCSARCHEMLGYAHEEIECSPEALWRLVHPDDKAGMKAALCVPDAGQGMAVASATQGGGSACALDMFEVQYRLRAKDGSWKWILAQGRVLSRRDDGFPARVVGTHTDITAAVSQRMALSRSEGLFRSVFSTAPVGIALLDRYGVLADVNEVCAGMLGCAADEVRGQHFSRFMHEEEAPQAAATLSRLMDGTQASSHMQHRLRRKDGSPLWADISASPLSGNGAAAGAVLAIIVDINDLRMALLAREDSERRYRALFENAQVGIFRTRIADGRFLEANARIMEMYGWQDRNEFLETMRAGDWYVDPKARGRMLHLLLRDGEFRNVEVEMRRRDGTTVWFEYSGRLDGDTIIGVAQDVTQRREAETARKRSEAHYRMLFEAAADSIFLCEPEGRFLDVNEVACRRLGYTRDELLAMSPQTLDTPEYADLVADRVRKLGDVGSLTFESAHRTRNGTVMPVEIHAKMLDFDGKPVVISIVRDITDRKRLEQALLREASTDPLTGIRNRRQFFVDAEREMGRSLRYGNHMAVLMLDVDRFKRINDRFGHHAGDAVLTGCVRACQQELRETDILGRIGGEEFAAVLLETDMDEALAVAERLRRAVEAAGVEYDGQTLRCTMSIGLAVRGPEDTAFDDILRRADSALYAAKEAGRNRVMLSGATAARADRLGRRAGNG